MSDCCRQLIGELRSIQSPFARLLATGYYDGPTDGIVECGECQTLYAFHKIDWDEGQDLRVFSLAPTYGSFNDIENNSPTKAKWPSWVLTRKEVHKSGDNAQQVIDEACAVEFVVASRDLLAIIDVWRPAGLPEGIDWFQEMACQRESDQ